MAVPSSYRYTEFTKVEILNIKSGKTCYVYISLLVGSSFIEIPAGKYKVREGKRNGETYTLSIADNLYDSDKAYKTTISSFPTNAEIVVGDVCNDLGITT